MSSTHRDSEVYCVLGFLALNIIFGCCCFCFFHQEKMLPSIVLGAIHQEIRPECRERKTEASMHHTMVGTLASPVPLSSMAGVLCSALMLASLTWRYQRR